MTVIKGATVVAAVAPEMKSEAKRKPKFFVFHIFLASCKGSEAFGDRVMAFEEASMFFDVGGTGSPDISELIDGALTTVYKILLLHPWTADARR